jgi:hypothetical protein
MQLLKIFINILRIRLTNFYLDLFVESYIKNKFIGVTIINIIDMSFNIYRKGLN